MRETMRNSVRMHPGKSRVEPRRICSSTILRLVGDFVRIKAAVVEAKSAVRLAVAASASSAARMASIRSWVNSRSIVPRIAITGPSPGGCAKAPRMGSARTRAAERSGKLGKASGGAGVGGDPRRRRVGGGEPLAGQRAIAAEPARQARQEPGRPDVGEKADADLRHREQEFVA